MIQVGMKLKILKDRADGSRVAAGEVVEVVGVPIPREIDIGFVDVRSVHTGDWSLGLDGFGTNFVIYDPTVPAAPSGDAINHPAHYNQGKIEVIEFIEDKNLGFHLGNAVKYIARAGKKDPAKEIEDLKKAVWYLERHIELISGGTRRPNEMVTK